MNKTATGLTGALLALLILIPAALYGGKHELAIPAAAGLIVLTAIVIRRYPAVRKLPPSVWPLLLFLLWLAISTSFFSTRPYASAVAMIPIFAGALIFLLLQSFPPGPKTLKIFSGALLGGAAIVILYGLYIYLSPRFPSLRMGGVFRQHNAWAGLLAALLPLSVYTALFEKKARLIWNLAAVLITSALVLTFSRGGFIAAAAALVIFLGLLWRQNQHCQGETLPVAGKVSPYRTHWTTVQALLIITIGGLLAYGLYSVKTANFATVGIAVANSPYAGERPEQGETSVNARLEYWRAALKIFKEKPLIGRGLDTFGQEYRRIQTDPRFYSVDPHNLPLKLLAELGLIGTILFILFLISSVWPKLKAGWQRQNKAPATIVLLAGLIGLLLHYGVDLDLTFPAHYLIFFTLAGLVAKPETESADNENSHRTRYPIFLIAALILFLLTAVRYTSHYYFERVKLVSTTEGNGNLVSFEKLLAQSERYNPFNPGRALSVARFYLENGDRERALLFARKAAAIQPLDSDTRLITGQILAGLEENAVAEAELRLAIEYAPARDLEAYVHLVNLLEKTGQRAEAKEMATAGLAYFPEELFDSSLWVNYDKNTTKFHRFLLTAYLQNN